MKVLIIVPEYPSATSIGYQFVHDRVKEYQKHFAVEVFCCQSDLEEGYVHENVAVSVGSNRKLIKKIKSGEYTHFVIHYLTLTNALIALFYLRGKKTFIWSHGSDFLHWRRRLCRIEHRQQVEWAPIYAARVAGLALSNRLRSWLIKRINRISQHLTVVFVSEWGLKASEEDNHEKFQNAVVIPNYINEQTFIYQQKKPSDRYRVLSISSYATNVYAGDIQRDILLAFSREPLFKKFNFELYGDGVLFKRYTDPLQEFDNVHIQRGFLTHQQIVEKHSHHGILFYPKRGDTQGVSRCEAMLSGLVPLASDAEAISEYSPVSTSYLAVTVEEFIAAFKEIDANPEAFLEKSKAGAEFIREKCSYANTIEKEIALLTAE